MIRAAFYWVKKNKIISIVLLLILVVVGVLIYQKVALELNKRAFMQARAAIDTVYADIVSEVGPPNNYRRTSECSRPSVEFGKGPLSCDVGTDFIYGVTDKQEADNLKLRIHDVIKKHPELLNFSSAPQSFINVNPAPGNNIDSSIDYYKTKAGMECSVKYTFDIPAETYLDLHAANEKTLYAVAGCSAKSKAEYYPIR